MNRSKKKYSTFFLLLFAVASFAQIPNKEFEAVDAYVKSLGSLDTLNAGTISYIVTKKFPDNKDKVRAIFDWITNNISFDCKKSRNGGNEKMVAEEVLKTRKANASGYATLFQDMCSVVKIRCLTVDGYAKYNTEHINEKPDGFNHTWDVVQLGQSTESWYYIDPTWGSGFTDEKMSIFTQSFNDAYFFADKVIFNYQHYPDNPAWLLGAGIGGLKNFLSMPIVKNAAYEFGCHSFSPISGYIKTKMKTPVQFSLKVAGGVAIDIVSLYIGEGKKRQQKTVNYIIKNGSITFSYKFDEEDTYPVFVRINNKEVLGYVIEVIE